MNFLFFLSVSLHVGLFGHGLNTASPVSSTSEKSEVKNSDHYLTVDNALGVFFCAEKNCVKITTYHVAKNNSHDCHEKYLGIYFTFKSVETYAYLQPMNSEIAFSQSSDDKGCPRIKR